MYLKKLLPLLLCHMALSVHAQQNDNAKLILGHWQISYLTAPGGLECDLDTPAHNLRVLLQRQFRRDPDHIFTAADSARVLQNIDSLTSTELPRGSFDFGADGRCTIHMKAIGPDSKMAD